MKFRIFVVSMVALALAPAGLEAQRDDQFSWGVGLGGTIPSGLAGDNHEAGVHGVAMFGIGSVDSRFGIRFDGLYSLLADGDDDNVSIDQGEARVFALMGNAVVPLIGSNTRIYGLGGLGGFWYNPDGPGTTAVNDFGINLGLGIWLPRINGFVEAKWMNLYRALPDPRTGLKGKKSARLYPITLGIMF